jgi:hypothetical protein
MKSDFLVNEGAVALRVGEDDIALAMIVGWDRWRRLGRRHLRQWRKFDERCRVASLVRDAATGRAGTRGLTQQVD